MADAQVRLFGGRPQNQARLSACGTYRYVLTREVADRAGSLVAIGLNPSTADASVDDPTTVRLANRARAMGLGRLVLINLYALRSRDPLLLVSHPDPVGPEWDRWSGGVLRSLCTGDVVLACWGASGPRGDRRRQDHVAALLVGWPVWCLGTCGDGSPRHPLYVRADAALVPWAP